MRQRPANSCTGREPALQIRSYLVDDFRTRIVPPMTTPAGSDIFYGSIPVFRGFARLMDPALYSPLPDDWTIGIADIVESTKAIAQARYKTVNMAGAAG